MSFFCVSHVATPKRCPPSIKTGQSHSHMFATSLLARRMTQARRLDNPGMEQVRSRKNGRTKLWLTKKKIGISSGYNGNMGISWEQNGNIMGIYHPVSSNMEGCWEFRRKWTLKLGKQCNETKWRICQQTVFDHQRIYNIYSRAISSL